MGFQIDVLNSLFDWLIDFKPFFDWFIAPWIQHHFENPTEGRSRGRFENFYIVFRFWVTIYSFNILKSTKASPGRKWGWNRVIYRTSAMLCHFFALANLQWAGNHVGMYQEGFHWATLPVIGHPIRFKWKTLKVPSGFQCRKLMKSSPISWSVYDMFYDIIWSFNEILVFFIWKMRLTQSVNSPGSRFGLIVVEQLTAEDGWFQT